MNGIIQYLAFYVDRTPEVHSATADRGGHLVQGSSIIRPWPPIPKPLGIFGSESGAPTVNRLITHVDPSIRQQVFDTTQTEIEPNMEPDDMPDDRRRELETGVRDRARQPIIALDPRRAVVV